MLSSAMCLIQRMRAGLGALKRSERGFAVPTVLTVMVIGMGFSAVAVTVAITSQSETTRDYNRKAALALADAGAQRALYTYNKITTTAATPCVQKTVAPAPVTLTPGPVPATTNPFCGPVGGPDDPDARVGNGYFTYWVAPCLGAMQLGVCNWGSQRRRIKIVSQGCSNTSRTCAGGISRRVAIVASGIPGSAATGNAKAIGLEGITMAGWTEMEVPAATNKSFVMKKEGGCPGNGADADGQYDDNPMDPRNGCPRICPGDWKYPVEVSVGPDPNDLIEAPGTQRCTAGRNNPPGPPESDAVVLKRTITLAPVDIGTAKTSNDNGRLLLLNKPGGDTMNGPGTVNWDPVTKTLTMNGTGDVGNRLTLNLGGRNYLFCKVQLNGWSQLQTVNTVPMPGTNNVASKLFFDSPENCPGTPTTQISVQGGSNFNSSAWNAFTKPPDGPGTLPLIVMAGSTSTRTVAEFRTGTWFYANKVMFYAPRTDIVLNTWARENEGWFAGRTITMAAGAEIESPPYLDPVGVGIVPADFILFHQNSYVECGPKGTSIDANC
jgi:hypothetical protein